MNNFSNLITGNWTTFRSVIPPFHSKRKTDFRTVSVKIFVVISPSPVVTPLLFITLRMFLRDKHSQFPSASSLSGVMNFWTKNIRRNTLQNENIRSYNRVSKRRAVKLAGSFQYCESKLSASLEVLISRKGFVNFVKFAKVG